MQWKKRMALACAGVMLLSMVGCSGSGSTVTDSETVSQASSEQAQTEGDTIELTYYFPTQTSGPLAVTMEEIVDAYNEQTPGVHVNAVFTGDYAATMEKTLTSIAGGNAPHVVLSSGNLIPYLELDALVDVRPLLEEEGEEFLSDYVENFWTIFTFGDHIWGVPFQHSAPIMYYNKDLFAEAGLDPEKAPATWSELKTAAEAIAASNPDVVPFEFMGDDWIIQAMACSNGGNTFTDETTVTFNDKSVVEAVEYWQDLLNSGLAMNTKSYGTVTENFLAGSTAIMFNSTGSLGNVTTNATFDWDIAEIPANDGQTAAAPLGGGGLVMLAGHPQEEQDAAWEFVKYLTSPEVSAKWSITSGYFAVRHSSYDLPEMQEYFSTKPQFAKTQEFLPNLVKPYMTIKQTEVSEDLVLALDEALINGADAQTVLDQAQNDAQAVLDETAAAE